MATLAKNGIFCDMFESVNLARRHLALQLHFSAAPAPLALRLLWQAEEFGYRDIAQFTRANWQRAQEDCAAEFTEAMPQTTWTHWQTSRRKIRERSWDLTQSVEDLLIYGSADYPQLLYQLFHPPFILFFRGEHRLLQQDSGFAVCGSRKVTLQGRSDAFALGYGVGSDYYLISGLSEGIELAACEGALAAGRPAIGVLCCGLKAISPPESLQMAAQILAAGGLLLSEYPSLQPRQRYTFLQRNRILAALAASLLMVELGPKTKSLNLVDYALELNRDLAVLGDSVGVQHLRQQGCPHWPDAPTLLKALGMECAVEQPKYRADRNIGQLVADGVYEELQQQCQHYLGRRVGN